MFEEQLVKSPSCSRTPDNTLVDNDRNSGDVDLISTETEESTDSAVLADVVSKVEQGGKLDNQDNDVTAEERMHVSALLERACELTCTCMSKIGNGKLYCIVLYCI